MTILQLKIERKIHISRYSMLTVLSTHSSDNWLWHVNIKRNSITRKRSSILKRNNEFNHNMFFFYYRYVFIIIRIWIRAFKIKYVSWISVLLILGIHFYIYLFIYNKFRIIRNIRFKNILNYATFSLITVSLKEN